MGIEGRFGEVLRFGIVVCAAALCGTASLWSPAPASAARTEPTAPGVAAPELPEPKFREPLRVAVKVLPPFAVRHEDGSFGGLAVDLWTEVADALELESRFEETDLEALLSGVAAGAYDVGVGALSVTAERESWLDFTHAYFQSGLAIAVPEERDPFWVVRRLFSVELLQALAALGTVLLLVGAVVWVFERRKNPEDFGGSTIEGLGSGLWWAAVTMTTVGFGDKAPKSFGGRIVGLVWMFAAILLISSFTAAIATALTVGQLSRSISGPRDLAGVPVATVDGSTSESYLRRQRIPHTTFEDLEAALAAVANGRPRAIVYDAPVLRWRVAQDFDERIDVLPGTFDPQPYAFALTADSELRESINVELLRQTSSADWRARVARELGEP